MKCVVLDKAYCDFEFCHIKSVNRSYKYVSTKLALLQEPIEELTVGETSIIYLSNVSDLFHFLFTD